MNYSRFRICGLCLFLLASVSLQAQRRGGGGSSMQNQAGSDLVVHGSVVLPDAVIPDQLVRVERWCGGRMESIAYADSKGHFMFDLGMLDKGAGSIVPSGVLVISAATMKGCTLRASLTGYHPQSIPLEPVVKAEKTNLGELVLQPIGKQQSVLLSATDADVPKNVRKEYDKALDFVSKAKLPDAIASMEKATAGYPKFATAWLSLGLLQSGTDTAAALKSFAQAMAADEKFAPPYIEAANVEAGANQWAQVIEHTNKAIALEPDSFARAYYLNAIANIRLNQAENARKSIAEGLRVDTDHEYTDLEYIDGFLMLNKGDKEGARKRFESYLEIAPNGTNAGNAKQLLSDLQPKK